MDTCFRPTLIQARAALTLRLCAAQDAAFSLPVLKRA